MLVFSEHALLEQHLYSHLLNVYMVCDREFVMLP